MKMQNVTVTIDDINRKLSSAGIAETCSDKEKVCHIFAFYQQAEVSLNAALENIEILSEQFNADRKQFDGYVEHINQLSQGREDLILEYEAENKELRQDIETLAEQLASFRNPETEQALKDRGYGDIAKNKSREQISFLLIEIERLKSDVEAAKEQCLIQTPDGQYTAEQLYKLLQSDRHPGSPRRSGRHFAIPGESGGSGSESYSDLKDLLRNVDDLEITNELLKERLKAVSPKDYEDVMSGRRNFDSPVVVQQKSAEKRRQEAIEKTIWTPPKDMDEATTRLREAELRSTEAEILEEELNEKVAEVERLKRRIRLADGLGLGSVNGGDGDVRKRDDRRHEIDMEKHNEDINRILGSVEARLQAMKLATADEKESSGDKKAILDQLQNVQREFEQIKIELVKMMKKYDQQYRKYTDHKLSSKNKLFKTKERFKIEKQKLNEKTEHLENELALIKVTLAKELEYKDNMEKSHHNLLTEQKDIHYKLSEQEEANQENIRQLSSLKVRAQYLEDDNTALNQRIEAITKQKYSLEKIIKEYQMEREKEDIYRIISSGVGPQETASFTMNSFNRTAEDEQEVLEALLSARSNAGSLSPRRHLDK